ncbi:chaperone NapD [Paracoccus sp. CPCC 101403]|uniref:Chaperone NapD n=1 Tax=Paracoccus broussonetiae TaxID=3075834 RepID=A0ABU3EKQ4_9RHOB|nr:chaperone NapD [Paracoccus sp. CPCC 101403]MDT1064671.1 chaperone NapD [Paracoccus sp. CPCC 101403]
MKHEAWHVSSAVVSVIPGRMPAVLNALSGHRNVEVHGRDERRIVVTIEGRSSGELGQKLSEINLIDGVLGANMVFEHAEKAE